MHAGSIVEIMNLSEDQINSISSQRCIAPRDIDNYIRPIIGMRYKVKSVVRKDYGRNIGEDEIELWGWNHGGHFIYFEPTQLREV